MPLILTDNNYLQLSANSTLACEKLLAIEKLLAVQSIPPCGQKWNLRVAELESILIRQECITTVWTQD